MKRYNNLFGQICTIENIELAERKARKHKSKSYGVKQYEENKEEKNRKLLEALKILKFKTSKYKPSKIYEPKERILFKLPYYPDRIAHHAIMNILESIWTKLFINNTYSCIKGRGIHKLLLDLIRDLNYYSDKTVYCLKLDIKKFYHSIDRTILKQIIRRKIKDNKLLIVLDEIIDSVRYDNIEIRKNIMLNPDGTLKELPGVPIGNYPSLFFGNLYLTPFDHWIKEVLKCKFYYRYADDIVVLSDNKEFLHKVFLSIKTYLYNNLKLEVKSNYLIFPIESRGIDFVGYVFRHKYTKLRKSLKLRIKKLVNKYVNNKINKNEFYQGMTSYRGWLKYCNARNFAQSLELKSKFRLSLWKGELTGVTKIPKHYIIEYLFDSKYELHTVYKNKSYVIKCKKFPKNYKMI